MRSRFILRYCALSAITMAGMAYAAPPAPAPEEAQTVAEAPAAAETAPPADTGEKKEAAAEDNFKHIPMFTGSVGAPGSGQLRGSMLDMGERNSIKDALTRPIEFGQPSLGFQPPDWTEPLRDVEADGLSTNLATGETVLTNNVRLRLGEMYFRADNFSYAETAGDYSAVGHVAVEQAESKMTADSIVYQVPDQEAVRETFILEPRDDASFAKKRLTMGRLLADMVRVSEPTRTLSADHVDYDFATQKGELINARGQASMFYYRAGKLQILGPDDMRAQRVWLTTCPNEDPHYRVLIDDLIVENGEVVLAKGARLQIGKFKTPLFLPFFVTNEGPYPWSLDFDTGRYAGIGSYVNVGQRIEISPELALGPRIMPTDKAGIGFGGDVYYDYMKTPVSPLYRTKGEIHGLYTTKDRGYFSWAHRYEYDEDLVLRMQAEQWSDQDFYKDFFYDEYRNRTTPRTFANLTLRKDEYIATGTLQTNTHSWAPETERLPEATFHLLERPVADNLYVTFDTINGYNNREQLEEHGLRTVNIGRISYDWDPAYWLAVTPFYEVEGAWYQNSLDNDHADTRLSNLVGVTLQTRFSKVYPGFGNFSGFKHMVVPSLTYSYRPSPSMDLEDTPQYDALDNVYGRSRIEAKISNIVYGRDAETKQVWQVGRLTLYQGSDFWNEVQKAQDHEIEIDIRPRAWWGVQFVGERHDSDDDTGGTLREKATNDFYWSYLDIMGRPYSERAFEVSTNNVDYSRILTQVYYDDTSIGGRFTTRVGYMYSDTAGYIYNREILYGLGYKLDDNWSVGFEHIFDLKNNDLRRQTYEIRRRFHCIDTALRFRDRESGFDVNFEVGLANFPAKKPSF